MSAPRVKMVAALKKKKKKKKKRWRLFKIDRAH